MKRPFRPTVICFVEANVRRTTAGAAATQARNRRPVTYQVGNTENDKTRPATPRPGKAA